MWQLSPPPYPYPPKRGDRSAFHFQTISALKTMLDKPWPNRESEPEWKSSFIETINWLSFLPCLLSPFFHTSDSYSFVQILTFTISVQYLWLVCVNINYITCKVYNWGPGGPREIHVCNLQSWLVGTKVLLNIYSKNAAEAYLYE